MAFVRLPLGIRIAMEYQVFGKVVVNVYHVTTTDPILTVKLFDIAQVFEDWWVVDLAQRFSEDITLNLISALNLDVDNGEKIELVVVPAEPGTEALDAVPNNVAIVATLETAKSGRSFRGRAFHAGLSESLVTGNDIGVGKAAGIATAYAQLQADLNVENAMLVVASFQTLGAPRAEGVATEVISTAVNLRVDTQRRRLPTL